MSLQAKIRELTSAAGIAYDIVSSSEDGDYRFLQKYIEEKNVTDVVIAGGDGTISQVVGALRHLPCRFGIIPCGSGNGLSLAARIPKNPDQAIRLVLEGEARQTDGFTVNGQFACMLCGLGFDAQVAHDFARQSRRGLSTYVKQVMKNFFHAHPFHFDMIAGEKLIHTNAYFISVANSNQFGNHFTIAPKAQLSDGLLDVVVVTAQSRLSLLWQTFRQVRGINKLEQVSVVEHRKGVIYFQVKNLKLVNHDGAPMHVDGDPAASVGEVSFSILEKCFDLYRP